MKKKPWQDENGNDLNESELRELSQHWTIEEWEEFQSEGLTSIEAAIDQPQTGVDINGLFSNEDCIWDYIGNPKKFKIKESLALKIRSELSKISSKERYLLELLFVHQMTIPEAANHLNEKINTVWRRRKRVIEKLKAGLKGTLNR